MLLHEVGAATQLDGAGCPAGGTRGACRISLRLGQVDLHIRLIVRVDEAARLPRLQLPVLVLQRRGPVARSLEVVLHGARVPVLHGLMAEGRIALEVGVLVHAGPLRTVVHLLLLERVQLLVGLILRHGGVGSGLLAGHGQLGAATGSLLVADNLIGLLRYLATHARVVACGRGALVQLNVVELDGADVRARDDATLAGGHGLVLANSARFIVMLLLILDLDERFVRVRLALIRVQAITRDSRRRVLYVHVSVAVTGVGALEVVSLHGRRGVILPVVLLDETLL